MSVSRRRRQRQHNRPSILKSSQENLSPVSENSNKQLKAVGAIVAWIRGAAVFPKDISTHTMRFAKEILALNEIILGSKLFANE